MNKKGFVMAEALIVSAVVLTTLVLIYTQFARIKKNYGDSYFYDNINDIYALNRIASLIDEENNQTITNNLSSYLDITNCTLFRETDYCELLIEKANIKYLLFTHLDKNYIIQALNSNNPYDLKLTTYIKNLTDSDSDYAYRLIAEFNDGTYASIPYGEASVMLGSSWFDAIANDGITKNDILSITTQDYIHYNDTYNKVYDISLKQNNKVKAYLINTETEGKYNIVLAATNGVYANPDSSSLFQDFRNLDILDLSKFNTSRATNMNNIFYTTGYNSTTFALILGNNFDTSNVEYMNNMFNSTGYNSTSFTLDLGDKFDTSKVKQMDHMFYATGRNSTAISLDLGNKFNTSKVTTMNNMFRLVGVASPNFTLNLGNEFDTSNVRDMYRMFYETGYENKSFTLSLGNKFNTSKVTNMAEMFRNIGYKSTVFTLDLGTNFNTSNVEDMSGMFRSAGFSSTVFTLSLGNKFDTSNVTDMNNMFRYTGYSSTVFALNLGDKFNTSLVEDMSYMFHATGFNSTSFILNLGSQFTTSNVTNMESMFTQVGGATTDVTVDISYFSFTSSPTITNMFGEIRNRSITFLVKDAAAQTYLTPAVINKVTLSIKP